MHRGHRIARQWRSTSGLAGNKNGLSLLPDGEDSSKRGIKVSSWERVSRKTFETGRGEKSGNERNQKIGRGTTGLDRR